MNMDMLKQLLEQQHTDAHFDLFLQFLDRLHDAATAEALHEVSPLDAREILGWLDDFIYTAQETVREIEDSTQPAALHRYEHSNN